MQYIKKIYSKSVNDAKCLRWVALYIALAVGGVLLTLGVLTYRSYNASMLDLGNMSQAIWSATQGRPLEFTHPNGQIQYSRLSWHAEFIYFLIAPLYALFPSPVTLLVIQAILFIAGAAPLYNLTYRRTKHGWVALVIVIIYVLYPVAQTAMLWNFHSDTLAMPLFLFVIDALDRRDWHAYSVWLVLVLSCKIYVTIPVAALGAVLWLIGQRKSGFYTLAAGILWGLVVVVIVRPLFASPAIDTVQKSLREYLIFHFQFSLNSLQASLLDRFVTASVVFLPVAIYARHSVLWMLPAYAVIIPVLCSSGPGPSYRYVYHHYALAVPFLLTGVVYGTERLMKSGKTLHWRKGRLPVWKVSLLFSLFVTIFINIFATNTMLSMDVLLDRQSGGEYEMNYGRTRRDQLKDEFLQLNIPADTPIAISSLLAPHVANRRILFGSDNISETKLTDIDIAIYDALYDKYAMDDSVNFLGGALYDWDKIKLLLEHPDFKLVDAQDGLLLFKRNTNERELINFVDITSGIDVVESYIASFDNVIKLVDASVSPIEGYYYELNFTWYVVKTLKVEPLMFAVSELTGVDNTRFVHLPTSVVQPSITWEKGDLISEVFDIKLPENIESGRYTLRTGWYDSGNPYAFKTDERSRIGDEVVAGEVIVD
jgi:uncharacterized membrane protein